jgi:acetyl-CoA C-acetyltransferase
LSVVVLSAVRSPYGRILGALGGLAPDRLGAQVVVEAIRRSGVPAEAVERLLLGNAAWAPSRGNPAGAVAAAAGLPGSCLPAAVRAGCASGLLAVLFGIEAILAGSCRAVAVGGVESASFAPHLASGLRRGLRLGGGALLDAARHDGPTAAAGGSAAPSDGDRPSAPTAFEGEVAPIAVPGRGPGASITVVEDEPAAGPETGPAPAAGDPSPSPPPLADGAAALVLASEAWAAGRGLEILARVRAAAAWSAELDAVSWIESDLAGDSAAELARLLPPGSRIAGGGFPPAGHATGADGARLAVRLTHAVRRAGGGRGLALAAGAWGERAAIVVEA